MNNLVRTAVVFAAGAVALGLAGCSPTPTPPESSATSPQAPATPPSAAPASAAPTAAPTPRPTEQPVAVRPGAFDKTAVNAYIYPVRRSGQTATANVLIRSEDPDKEFMVSTALGDGNPEVSAQNLGSVDGIRLIDNTAKKAYLPATTGEGVCLCSPTDDAAYAFNTTMWVTVVFAAPPEATSKVDLLLPVFGTVTDVPVA
jgi:hypothetical protein